MLGADAWLRWTCKVGAVVREVDEAERACPEEGASSIVWPSKAVLSVSRGFGESIKVCNAIAMGPRSSRAAVNLLSNSPKESGVGAMRCGPERPE